MSAVTHMETIAPPKTKTKPREEKVTLLTPQYHVVLLDDDDHTYAYVIEMLMSLFGHSEGKAFLMAQEVDRSGRVIVDGHDLSTIERDDLVELRRRMGYLFQEGALINWLSVGENVALPLRENTNLPINVDEEPLTCVVRGTGRILDDPDKYRGVLVLSGRN